MMKGSDQRLLFIVFPRFPAQNAGGNAKIPTVLWYDLQGQVRAIGAEALEQKTLENAEDQEWVEAKW
jgi:hypothetical protein